MSLIHLGGLDAAIVVRIAALSAGCFLVWLLAFERWLDPLLRRAIGAALGCPVVWVSAGAYFRVWGLGAEKASSLNAAVAAIGSMAVLCSSLLPAIGVGVGVGFATNDATVKASSYLMSFPMIGIFVLHVLWRGPENR
jgi:uncharacterized membrane protein YqaE (UPF0057 family)